MRLRWRWRSAALLWACLLVTSVLCGIAPNFELLILFRILQGVAGALLVPGSLALLTVTFSGEAQGRAFGLWAAASAATTILGPFVGGILVDSVSWRAVRGNVGTKAPTCTCTGRNHLCGGYWPSAGSTT